MIHVSYLNCIIQLRLSLELDINNCQPGMSCFSLGFQHMETSHLRLTIIDVHLLRWRQTFHYTKKTKEITGVLCSVLWIVVCTFILFLVAIVLSVPFLLAACDYPCVIFKLFLEYFSMVLSWIIWLINKPCIYCMIILNLKIQIVVS